MKEETVMDDDRPDTIEEVEAKRVRIRDASHAVANAASPRLLAAVRDKSITWPLVRPVGDVASLLVAALEQDWHADRTIPWWTATGDNLLAALCHVVRDLDEVEGSFILGAAVQAHLLGGADMAPDAILRLSERAACWAAGVDMMDSNGWSIT